MTTAEKLIGHIESECDAPVDAPLTSPIECPQSAQGARYVLGEFRTALPDIQREAFEAGWMSHDTACTGFGCDICGPELEEAFAEYNEPKTTSHRQSD